MSNISSIVESAKMHKFKIIYSLCFVALLAVIIYPEIVLAVNLEDQLDRVNTLTSDKIKKYGVTGATILSVIGAIFKGNIKLAGVAIIIGIMLSMFLSWVAGGMLV